MAGSARNRRLAGKHLIGDPKSYPRSYPQSYPKGYPNSYRKRSPPPKATPKQPRTLLVT